MILEKVGRGAAELWFFFAWFIVYFGLADFLKIGSSALQWPFNGLLFFLLYLGLKLIAKKYAKHGQKGYGHPKASLLRVGVLLIAGGAFAALYFILWRFVPHWFEGTQVVIGLSIVFIPMLVFVSVFEATIMNDDND
jgi:hypothetical protein